jgi:Xaa-Pro aminopeptidase
MVFCVETPYYEIGWGGMMVEDTAIITQDGHELLTNSSRLLGPLPAGRG